MRTPDYPSSENEKWSRVDGYFSTLLAPQDSAQQAAIADNTAAGLPPHDVSALQGKMLSLFVKMTGASRILEIGTLGGYSTICMARSLPENGKIVTLEFNPHHAEVARTNIERAGLAEHVDIKIGAALETLPQLEGTFDLIFIDADKPNNPEYLKWALHLSRPGTVIIGDNVVRGGAVINPDSDDANVIGIRTFLEMLAENPLLEATAIQTVGEKGWDGFALARVKDTSTD